MTACSQTCEKVIGFATVRAQIYFEVVGIGSTIAVRFPKGEMKAFEACELEKVTNAELPLRKMRTHGYIEEQRRGSVEQYMLLIVVSLLYLIMLGWWLMAGGGR